MPAELVGASVPEVDVVVGSVVTLGSVVGTFGSHRKRRGASLILILVWSSSQAVYDIGIGRLLYKRLYKVWIFQTV